MTATTHALPAICARVRERRDALGFSRTKLGELAGGYNASSIGNLESGYVPKKSDLLARVLDALDAAERDRQLDDRALASAAHL